MKKKWVLPFLAIAILFASVWFVFYGENDANRVLRIPSGFVHLESNLKNGLKYMPFETQISFLDADGIGLYSTELKNSKFIVRYQGEYYVKEEKLLELIDIAAISPTQRRKTYQLGDEVAIYGTGEAAYTVKIISVEKGTAEPLYMDSLTTYYIKFLIDAGVTEQEMKRIFAQGVETKGGVHYSSLDLIDRETMRVKIRTRDNDQIDAIILQSPNCSGLTYRVTVGQEQ